MTLPPRAKTFEWNLNTLVSLAALISTVIGFIAIFVYKSRDIEDLQRWQISHVATHAEISAQQKQQDDRLTALERKQDGLEYRLVRLEQSTADIISTLKEIQQLISRQSGEMSMLSGDMKVFKEILQRLDARVGKIGAKPDDLFGCTDDRPIWISAAGVAHDATSPWRATVHPVECLTSMDEAAAKGYRAPLIVPKVHAAISEID
jgi:uncharacterized coiled-coil protein SlyX